MSATSDLKHPIVVNPPLEIAGPLAVWLVLQIFTLIAGATGLVITAREQVPPQAWAAGEMIVVQLLSAALLGPLLFAHWQRLLATLITAPPFLLTACFIATVSPASAWRATAVCAAWLLAIAFASKVGRRLAVAARLLIVLATVGDVAVSYLRVEWSAADGWSSGPITMTLTSLHGPLSWSEIFAVFVAIVGAAGLAFLSLFQRRARR